MATSTVPMFDPTGQVRQIPADQAPAALQAGGKTAVKIIDPTNTPRWIPSDQQDAALKAGGKLFDGKAITSSVPDDDTLGGQAQEALGGVKKDISETGLTAMKAIHGIPGVGDFLDKHTKFDTSMQETQANANAPLDTLAAKTGYGLVNVVEFLTGDEALKGLSLGSKLAKIAPALKIMEKFPKLAEAVQAGIRQGVVGAGQAAGHGADAKQAAEAGAITGLTGGGGELAFPALGEGMRSLLEKLRPSETEIAGETIPVLASQKKGAANVAREAATPGNTPEVAEAQQQGGQQAITNIAQRSTKEALEKSNALRKTAPITDPARLLQPPDDYSPFKFYIEGPPATEGIPSQEGGQNYAGGYDKPNPNHTPIEESGKPAQQQQLGSTADTIPDEAFTGHATTRANNWQYTPPEAGGEASGGTGGGRLVTTDPAQAQSTLSRLNDLAGSDGNGPSAVFKSLPKEQQTAIVAQRDSLQQQLGMYHAGQSLYPHFEPTDVNAALGHVTNFGEAADQIRAPQKAVYQTLDKESGGRFTALRNQIQAANKIMFEPTSMDAYEGAIQSKKEAEEEVQTIFNRSTSVNRKELTAANAGWRTASILDTIHSTVDGAFRGAPKDIADKFNMNRVLRGNSMTQRLNTMLRSTPRADLEHAIGPDGLENLYRVGDLLSKPDTSMQTQSAAKEIAKHMVRSTRGAIIGGLVGHVLGSTYQGALAGSVAEDSVRFVLRQAAINPRIGMLLDRAVRHNVNPKIFAPLIAATINENQDHHTEPKTEGQQ
jgi:hypothetical protein